MTAHERQGVSRWPLPKEYRFALLPSASEQSIWPRIALVMRAPADVVGGPFVALPSWADARVLLGCLVDADGAVHQWLEVAFQDPTRAADAFASAGAALTNHLLDERWQGLVDGLNASRLGPLIATGYERTPGPPIYFDPKNGILIAPRDRETGEAWMVCTDDAALAKAGLPTYSAGQARYWWLASRGSEGAFIPATPEAPVNEHTRAIGDVLPEVAALIPVNSAGGCWLVRRHLAIGFETLTSVLGGGTWEGVRHGRSNVPTIAPLDPTREVEKGAPLADGWLFQGRHGHWGRLIETLHLKLRALADAVEAVRAVTRETQTPLLNLTADSFRVELGDPGCGLPRLWSGRVVLTEPGGAIPLALERTTMRAFIRAANDTVSIYQPSAALGARGRGAVRLREIQGDDDAPILLGTLAAQEQLSCSRNDLIRLRLQVGTAHLDAFAHLDEEQAMAGGEWRFRTVPLRIERSLLDTLRSAVGVPLTDVAFELIPLHSTPHDLHALAILAVRTLLVDQDTSLPFASDEILSLARQIAAEHDETLPLTERLAALFERDARWVEALGPHRVTERPIVPGEAFDLIPRELWFDTLALIIRMLPGRGPDSWCSDLADAPISGLQRVYEPVVEHLEALLLRTRSLIVIDWRYNREIAGVIRRYAVGMERPTPV